jgi:Tol biopolymer transport system component
MYTKRGPKTRLDVWLLSLADKREIPLLTSAADEVYAEISPNGKWLAYASDETGEQHELYVQSFNPDGTLGNDRKRISSDGALRFAWSRDGKELFFTNRADRLMATSVKTDGPTFEYTPPKALFETRMLYQYGGADFFDVTPDGKFLIGTLVGEPTAPAPTIILNWTDLVKK